MEKMSEISMLFSRFCARASNRYHTYMVKYARAYYMTCFRDSSTGKPCCTDLMKSIVLDSLDGSSIFPFSNICFAPPPNMKSLLLKK